MLVINSWDIVILLSYNEFSVQQLLNFIQLQLKIDLFGEEHMNTMSQQLLDSFEQLPEMEKQQVAAEILRRTVSLDIPSLSDDELVSSAEAVFLNLDESEADNEQQ